MDIHSYFSGYVDGEGCFCVSVNKSIHHKFGWDIRPSFSVSQNSNRSQVLRMLHQHFGCGTLRPDRSDLTLKYEVRSIHDLVERIIPHFEEYPILSSKMGDFNTFAIICRLMYEQSHLTKEGFKQIINLAFTMNPSGIRKYSYEEVKI